MDPIEEMVFWGATGQAKVVREALSQTSLRLVATIDNDATIEAPFADVPLLHGRAGLEEWLGNRGGAAGLGFLVTMGGERGRTRCEIHDELVARGLAPLTAVHPRAYVAQGAAVGAGSQICAGAVIAVGARLGRDCIVNTSASVDHECDLGDGVHVAPGAHLAGLVRVGRHATIYTGAVVLPRLVIGEGAVVGAGAVVLHDVPAFTVVAGNPARILRRVDDVQG